MHRLRFLPRLISKLTTQNNGLILYSLLTFLKIHSMKMRFIRLQKVPKHKKFDYTPRHYDPQKEELMQRVEAAKGNSDLNVEASKGRIKSQLRRGRSNNPALRKQQVVKSNKLILAIIVMLVIGLFVMINVYLPKIVK